MDGPEQVLAQELWLYSSSIAHLQVQSGLCQYFLFSLSLFFLGVVLFLYLVFLSVYFLSVLFCFVKVLLFAMIFEF